MIITATKKALPNAADQLKPVTWEINIQQRPVSHSAFRLKAHELSSLLPAKLNHREIIPIFPSIPCQCTTHSKNQVRTFIPGITGHATRGSPLLRSVLPAIKTKGRLFTNSHNVEMDAMESPCSHTQVFTDVSNSSPNILIFINCQFLCEALIKIFQIFTYHLHPVHKGTVHYSAERNCWQSSQKSYHSPSYLTTFTWHLCPVLCK